MKKLSVIIAIVVAAGLFIGCVAAQRSEFYQHDSMYKDWDHLKYSWGGYKHQATESIEESSDENWWGLPVEDGQVR